MARDETEDRDFFIYSLIYSNKLAYLQLITGLVYGNSRPESQEKGCLNQTFSKTLKNTCI